jgi:hypothetical protein
VEETDDLPWHATLVLVEGTTSGIIHGWMNCEGTINVQTVNGSRLVARTVILLDPQATCAPSGTLTLHLTGADQASMRWVDSRHTNRVATGILVRR